MSDGVYWETLRPIVFKLISAGQKFKTQQGWLRDMREHDKDREGIDFEVELVDIGGETARFFTDNKEVLDVLKKAGAGATVAIGWKRKKGWNGCTITAWEIER